MGYIYKITNDINDKVYIGKTTQTVDKRWKEHIYDMRAGSQTHFHKAVRKYGVEHFSISVIEEYPNEELNKMEVYWIGRYNSYNQGYNSTIGGDGGKTSDYPKNHSPIYKIALNENRVLCEYNSIADAAVELGNKMYGRNISACCRGQQKQAYGFRWSYVDNLSFNSIQNNRYKKVYKIDPFTIQVVDSFKNVADAAESIDGTREGTPSTVIANACRNRHKWVDKPYGYAWAYEETLEDIKKRILDTNKIVVKRDRETGKILSYYSSKAQAQKSETNNTQGSLATRLKKIGQKIEYHGFIWELVNKVVLD